ncbi:unnamed protein product [Bursaphelenchus okinawaensis]|uniref:Uncharacterized protein n=1 Tax=Bursaphelenchus okinawaensis TaxID=465554 RepID=A0A811LQS5_9BILA|nr:unnamed protein product [Bursaphelenchus okinawaensis]CAG9127410.1 unnamed protein product [Bursaphelenchus okinawaensis]
MSDMVESVFLREVCSEDVNRKKDVIYFLYCVVGTLIICICIIGATVSAVGYRIYRDLDKISVMRALISNLEPDDEPSANAKTPLVQETVRLEPETAASTSRISDLPESSNNNNDEDYAEDLRVYERYKLRVKNFESKRKAPVTNNRPNKEGKTAKEGQKFEEAKTQMNPVSTAQLVTAVDNETKRGMKDSHTAPRTNKNGKPSRPIIKKSVIPVKETQSIHEEPASEQHTQQMSEVQEPRAIKTAPRSKY